MFAKSKPRTVDTGDESWDNLAIAIDSIELGIFELLDHLEDTA